MVMNLFLLQIRRQVVPNQVRLRAKLSASPLLLILLAAHRSMLRTNINAAASVPSGEESREMSLLYAGCSRSKGMPQAEETVNTTNLIGDR